MIDVKTLKFVMEYRWIFSNEIIACSKNKKQMMNSFVPENWYVLKTKPFAENKDYASIVIKQHNVFFLFEQTILQRNNRKNKVHLPLISSILFNTGTLKDFQILYGEFRLECVLHYLKKPAVNILSSHVWAFAIEVA